MEFVLGVGHEICSLIHIYLATKLKMFLDTVFT